MTLVIPLSWQALADRLAGEAWRRLIVVGATDQGKSAFCRFLAGQLWDRGPAVSLLDTDLGQKMVGPPACVTLGTWRGDGGVALDRLAFVGDTSPVAAVDAVVATAARLAEQSAGDRLLVNTSGLVRGPGIPLKGRKIAALAPDHVVAIGGGELAPILAPIPPGRLHRIEPSPAARRKSPAARGRNRRDALREALAGARPVRLPDAVVEELLATPPLPDGIRLCGLADAAGEDRGIGLARGDLLWTPVAPEGVRRVRLGMAVPAALAAAAGWPAGS